ncbi:PP2A5 [Symbiodinium necroappetens]|uniref:PP2A5 protein n=1 Tax=Symbiodinium necroappetens TaxID=1628268 RepID=A0A812MHL9_9DINO|nr:PP2A5 [Symbiodinium necroappetens]
MQRSPKTAPSTATTTTRRTSPTTTTTTGGNQGFLPDNSSPATTTTTTRPTAATATPSTTEAGATNTVETGGSAVEKTTTTEKSETHPYSEGTTTAMESQENAHSEETVMEPAPAPAPAPDPALAASPTAAEHADSEETTTAMAAEEHADSEETTTTTTIELRDMSDMWYWPHDDSEDDTTTPELGWKDKFKSYFGLALLEERVNDPETEQVELPIHCRDRLSQNETQEHEDYVHSILVAAEDMQFEARKIIDLQGEAAVCDDPQQASSENCKAMARDVITLKVFMELKGSKQVVEDLQDNMVAREEEVEVASRASQEYWPASGFSGLIDLVFLVAEPISPTPEHFRFSAMRGGMRQNMKGVDTWSMGPGDKVAINSIDHNIQLQQLGTISFIVAIILNTSISTLSSGAEGQAGIQFPETCLSRYPHREKAEALLVSASDILREATYLFDGGEFHLPRDPRKVGVHYHDDDDDFWQEGDTKDDVLGDVYDQLEYVSGDMAATLLIRDIQKELIRADQAGDSFGRRKLLNRLIREYHPDQNPGREEEVRPVFEYCLRMLRLCKDVT